MERRIEPPTSFECLLEYPMLHLSPFSKQQHIKTAQQVPCKVKAWVRGRGSAISKSTVHAQIAPQPGASERDEKMSPGLLIRKCM